LINHHKPAKLIEKLSKEISITGVMERSRFWDNIVDMNAICRLILMYNRLIDRKGKLHEYY